MIEVVGARPGEKLHEELWTSDDYVTPSEHPAIMQLDRPSIDSVWLESELQELERLVEGSETLELVGRLAAIARAPRRLGVTEVAAAVTATTTSETV
jgi:FlaA1/EpsC-like NDP-sugar epimerase